jgi:osmoprotectant transport system permease protein
VLSVAVVNIGRAIPSFAIIALVFPFSIRYGFGLGFWPTCVALVALGIPPMFTNTYAGVAGTPPETVEAARGVGMTGGQVLRQVELPTALPLIVTGIRISAVQIVATATLGAIVGYQCLGSLIVSGLQRSESGKADVLAGAVLVAVLALAVDAVLGRIEPRLTPWRHRLR